MNMIPDICQSTVHFGVVLGLGKILADSPWSDLEIDIRANNVIFRIHFEVQEVRRFRISNKESAA